MTNYSKLLEETDPLDLLTQDDLQASVRDLTAERDALRAKLRALQYAARNAHYLWIPQDREHVEHRNRFQLAIEASREDNL